MIVLLGGTSETARLAEALAGAGWRVLVSTATAAPLELEANPRVERRAGPLDAAALAALARERGASAIVDATHPYAVQAHATAIQAAQVAGIACLRWERPASELDDASNNGALIVASTHEEAARLAFAPGLPVLLLIGSRNVAPYAREAARRVVAVAARVLPMEDSLEACRRAGIPDDRVVAARGPFTVEDNLVLIERFGAGVVVTKDGGREGGMPEKLEAARRAGIQVVVVGRPASVEAPCFSSISDLLEALPPTGP